MQSRNSYYRDSGYSKFTTCSSTAMEGKKIIGQELLDRNSTENILIQISTFNTMLEIFILNIFFLLLF